MKQKSLTRNIFFNIINQISSILFQLISFPYITRILQTENYGKISFCNSIVSYFLLLAALGTSSYAIREGTKIRENETELSKFVSEMYTINFISSLFSFFLLLAVIFWAFNDSIPRVLLLILGSQVILNVFNVDWINNIFEDFEFIAIRNIIVQILSLVLILLTVTSKRNYIEYAIIISLSACTSSIYNFVRFKSKLKIHLEFNHDICRHIKSIVILFFNNVAVLIYVNSDVTMLGILKNDHIVGVYSSSVKIYSITKKIFQAIVISALPRMSYYINLSNKNKYRELLNKEIQTIMMIVIPALTGLFMIAKDTIIISSGPDYLEGKIALRILCIALFFSAIATVLTTSVLLPNKQENIILKSTLVASVVNLVLNFILIPHLSLNGAAITTVLAECIVVVISVRYSKEYNIIRIIINSIWKPLIGACGIVVVCSFINIITLHFIANMVLKILISGITYILIELCLKNEALIRIYGRFLLR